MAATVRATCPGCQTVLRIPAEWQDRPVRCKTCRATVRKAPSNGPVAAGGSDTQPIPHLREPTPAVFGPPAVPGSPFVGQPPLNPAAAFAASFHGQAAPGFPYPQPGQPYGVPPGYGYPGSPGHGHPTPTDPFALTDPPFAGDSPSAFADPSPVTQRSRRRGTSPVVKLLGLGAMVVGLLALSAGGVVGWPWVQQKFFAKADPFGPGSQQVDPSTEKTGKKAVAPPAAAAGPFPRRMLVMSVTKYLYCNTLSSGKGAKSGDHVSEVARRLAFDWKVPQEKDNNQLFVLSDSSPKDARPMLKPIVEQTYAKFCETSRPEDHVVLYFGGHAVEKDGKAYLVPVDGDLGEPDTLIPVDDLWAKLKECKAQQKVVVFDVCRLNEDGDTIRPGSEPMSEALEKKLLNGPPGVQVVTTCSAGQNALEFRQTPLQFENVGGSLFLSALRYVADKAKAAGGKPPTPDDPISIGPWVEAARARMKEIAAGTGKAVQSPKVAGSEGAAVAANPADPPAPRFDLPPAPKSAAVDDVARAVKTIDLPPVRSNPTAEEDPVETLVPFSADVMKDYKPGAVPDDAIKTDEKYKVRKAALKALETIHKEWTAATGGGKSAGLRELFAGDTNDKVKKEITAEQETPAKIIQELEDQVRDMEKVMDDLKSEESKFWQATFLYALAQLKTRLAFMHEYDFALGNIKTDSIPKADADKGQSGLQLVSVEKMKSKKDVKDIADEGRKLFTQVADEFKGTPWAIQAKRAKSVALGLEWRPYTPGGMRKDD